ncbi:RNA polymerase sigma factor [Microbacterium marinilacus]|uniref:RNA polymerase sigma factor n=1 Tax=Microbacterium marinilacus TaxID=415209 RepID=UPI001C8E49D0|nr:sigma-70 family RNA polymerase sigma factor [Microbacterium marinilacus]MBY0689582.1 sigma-70 family RNA polymerase sigma factor [Microbacterium marinilacus]
MAEEFRALFSENWSLVVAVAEQRLGSRADGEEIAAAAFRIAWERRSKGEEVTMPWLYGVVRNLVGAEYRRRKRQHELTARAGDHLEQPDPETEDAARDVRALVARLPAQHREVLRMAYWEDLSAQEIGEVLGLSPATVRVRLYRARRALKSLLENVTTEEVPTNVR